MKMHVDLQKRFPMCHVCPKCLAALLCGSASRKNVSTILQIGCGGNDTGRLVTWEFPLRTDSASWNSFESFMKFTSFCSSWSLPDNSMTVSWSSMNFFWVNSSKVEFWNFCNSFCFMRSCWWTSRKSCCCRNSSSCRILWSCSTRSWASQTPMLVKWKVSDLNPPPSPPPPSPEKRSILAPIFRWFFFCFFSPPPKKKRSILAPLTFPNVKNNAGKLTFFYWKVNSSCLGNITSFALSGEERQRLGSALLWSLWRARMPLSSGWEGVSGAPSAECARGWEIGGVTNSSFAQRQPRWRPSVNVSTVMCSAQSEVTISIRRGVAPWRHVLGKHRNCVSLPGVAWGPTKHGWPSN